LRRPRIVVVTTGDDSSARPAGEAAGAASARTRCAPHRASRGFGRHPRIICRTIGRCAPGSPGISTRDVLVLTGGVIMSRFDHVPAVLVELA
jgi:molybdopterin biosynthesis enzyme